MSKRTLIEFDEGPWLRAGRTILLIAAWGTGALLLVGGCLAGFLNWLLLSRCPNGHCPC